MGVEATPPTVAPFRSDHWKQFDDSVNAVSFGFVATAILISMFLLLAIFERFLRQRSSEASVATPIDLEHQIDFGGKFENLSPKVHFCSPPFIIWSFFHGFECAWATKSSTCIPTSNDVKHTRVFLLYMLLGQVEKDFQFSIR